jgi:hypothetical protein
MNNEMISTQGILLRCVFATGLVFLGYTIVGCSSTPFNLTEVVCTEEQAESTEPVENVVSVEVLDGSGAAVALADASLTITQTLEEFENGTTNHDLFPDYSYFSKLSFSYRDNGEDVAITLMADPGATLDFSTSVQMILTLNGAEQTLESVVQIVDSAFVHRVSVDYTAQGQARELVLTLDYTRVTIATVYSAAISCDLDCENIVSGLGDGVHRIECDYSCADGTQGDFESEESHADSDIDELFYLYSEAEIQAIAADCTFADYTQTTGTALTESFSVEINE